LWAGSGIQAAGDPLFAVPAPFSFTGTGSVFASALGDLNGDGKLDMVAATARGTATTMALLGTGDGTFGPPISFPGASSYVCIGELNGDGKADLVTQHSVRLGNGDGTFGPLVFEPPRGEEPYTDDAKLADLNHDGKLDLVVMFYYADYSINTGTLTVLLGNGDGTFDRLGTYETGIGSYSLAIGDLNGDRKQDAVTSNEEGTVSVLLGEGGGRFGPKIDYPTNRGVAYSVAIADLNSDGVLDLITANPVNQPEGVSVFLGNGDGTFVPASHVAVSPSILLNAMTIGDFNADSKPDLAVAKLNTVSVLLGNGDGTFGEETNYGEEPTAVMILSGDLNGDGKLDLVPWSTQGSYWVLLNIGPEALVGVDLNFNPQHLDLGSRQKWATATVLVAAPYDASQIDVGSIRLNDVVAVSAEREPRIGRQGRALAVAFSWDEVKGILEPGSEVPLTITGTIANRRFTGVDYVSVHGPRPAPSAAKGPAEWAEDGAAGLALQPSNPAVGALAIRYSLAGGEPATLAAYDVQGRRVATLEVSAGGTGWHTVNLGHLPSGVYWVRLSQAGRSVNSRAILLH